MFIQKTHLVQPQIGYSVWANADKDLIFGKGVTDLSDQDELYGSYIIPEGRYLKVFWNAETFEDLVMEGMEDWNFWQRAEADAFLEKNGLIADHVLDVDVYPHERMRVGCENGPDWGPKFMAASITQPVTEYPEMYYLFSVKNKK